ncbi:F0F1 ATP synthase subunit gamma [Gynuella sunshinyii]|uniref:ATP synthase gamma chain n=1 Tax=Gynuella sunshinyii YC6258 TaxID=1445510 RepID=A0A0C5VRD7_9GAMM|nr:F0F1 ATP synthase subunit gamma [Gynuella sunshinyii]AJQ92799.1 F0F1-type ATP synthase, gamma subunit [Gynuella sunshinyii YC6258]
MAAGKEIRSQIGSIKNTQKITNAMEMVATSKMRKAQDRMKASKPYSDKIRNVIGHLANANPEYHPLYMQEREIRKVGYIIVSTDRGLCGGLNINAFKKVVLDMQTWAHKSIGVEVCAVGAKGAGYFNGIGTSVVANISHLGDQPEVGDLIGGVKIMLDKYANGEIDRLILVYNEFVNTMTQAPVLRQLLPLEAEDDGNMRKHIWDYMYEPDARELLDGLIARYLESQVYQAVIENAACEQAARMMAMKAATDNAGELIKQLQLVYNKARQAAITQEISEIVGGAAAV